MYIGRKDFFQCDTCDKIEHVSNGLPKGWCWLKKGIGQNIEHACEECRKSLPKQNQFEAGQK